MGSGSVTDLAEAQVEARAGFIESLRRDLCGPAERDEVLDEPPLNVYMSAILYPSVDGGLPDKLEAAEQEEIEDDDIGEGPADPGVSLSNVQYPTSCGVSFAVDKDVDFLSVEVSAARYREEVEGQKSRWHRIEQEISPAQIALESGRDGSSRIADGLKLYWRCRKPIEASKSVTVVLINELEAVPGRKDEACFFQVEFVVTATDQRAPVFVARRTPLSISDDDLETNALLYRNCPEFAVGHGCAADWEIIDDKVRATAIKATFLPTYAVNLVESNSDIDVSELAFQDLANVERHELAARLEKFADAYQAWIEKTRSEIPNIHERHRETADKHMSQCETACERIRSGISVLLGDPDACRAFQLANQAMDRQMRRPDPESWTGKAPSWRPFQLGFVLLSIPSIVDREHKERDLVELLWFPTGGGKTEAYLALFAFTVFFRRIHHEDAGGVVALMRYTMRLLTIQQFLRAARVVCACELVRRSEGDLGVDPISVGLFVGKASTPNTVDEARKALRAFEGGKDSNEVREANPYQLRSCPWCDEPLDPERDYAVLTDPDRLTISCSGHTCEFSTHGSAGALPVHLVDDDLYRVRPTLVIGTVDKFAGLPWRPQIGRLFNYGTDDFPPDLIIQDELHLISGPLGTLTGLYETAVDMLCSAQGGVPKVVSSTATVRRAKTQIRGLFAREVSQFPPPGLEPSSNWFAVGSNQTGRDRQYVGVMAPGVSHSSLLIRVYASLLNHANRLDPGPVADPYWTLVGYFNSLRVLGAARMQVQDDVRYALSLLSADEPTREIGEPIELTSRVDSVRIPEILEQLHRSMEDEYAVDVLLSTSMISVGVDIDRLGLMTVMGQPQSASEYIQATSRVGRRYPGLVVTILNAARSRDRSHYEAFRGFHSTLYRSVEPTSVTPFSPRARDRGLHAVLVAVARQEIPELRENDAAGNIIHSEDKVRAVAEAIVGRVQQVDPDQVEATRRELDHVIARWMNLARDQETLHYEGSGEDSLLTDATPESILQGTRPYPTMRSLRDVDAETRLEPKRRNELVDT